jgi:hypothetical protein
VHLRALERRADNAQWLGSLITPAVVADKRRCQLFVRYAQKLSSASNTANLPVMP